MQIDTIAISFIVGLMIGAIMMFFYGAIISDQIDVNIDIQKDYHNELVTCKGELKKTNSLLTECRDAKTPDCPATTCYTNPYSSIFGAIIGILIMLGAWKLSELIKKDKEKNNKVKKHAKK